ncbi:MAG TPA: LysE family translocator [Burkholderiaceae bacterium]|nr:LysE family translocator [Burkholderiaceae bacterium]
MLDALGILHLGAFVAAGLALNVTPGPDLLYASTQAARHGTRAGWIAALGIGCGCAVHVALGALGVTALVAASPAAFGALKLAGAAWLAWLGLRMLLAPRKPAPVPAAAAPAAASAPAAAAPAAAASAAAAPASSAVAASAPAASAPAAPAAPREPFRAAAVWRDGFAVNVLNPKVGLFFVAFVPQFVDPAGAHPSLAFALLGAVFIANGTLVTGALAAIAAAGGRRLRAGGGAASRTLAVAARLLPRAIGAAFVGLGLRLALDGT